MRIYDPTGRALPAGLPPSYPDHVRNLLEQEIIDGRLAPGERVTEDDLATRFGVSRTPVREAMRALAAEGLIVRRRGRPTSVAPRITMDEASTLYEMRVALESYLARRAAELITQPELRVVARVKEEFRTIVEEQTDRVELRLLMTVDSDFHWAIYNAARSDLASILASYWGKIQRELYERVYTTEHPGLFAQQHEVIVGALENRDADLAQKAMAEHVRSGWDALRPSYEEDGRRVAE